MTTFGDHHDQGRRPVGSTDIVAVVATRGGTARPGQIQQDGGYCRSTDELASRLSATEGSESTRQVGELPADGEARLLEGGELAARESPGGRRKPPGAEEQGFQGRAKTAPPTGTSPRPNRRTTRRASSIQESDPPPRARPAAASSNGHLEEVLKGQAQQAEFLQHIWMQQTQMQQALQQQVCALTGAIQQLAETQQTVGTTTSEETRRKTSRG